MPKYEYDIVVIGGGAAGLTASKTAHGLGKKVALVDEKDRLGGECTWTGCVPSKALIKTAAVAYDAHTHIQYGLRYGNEINYDTSYVMNHARFVVHEVYKTHTPEKIKELGIDVRFGKTQFKDPHSLQVGDQIITACKFIITTGSSPFVPLIDGIKDVAYLTNDTLFELDTLPQSMIILGAGPIGIEMASALNRLGVNITVVEMQDHILPREDVELTEILIEEMKKEGVKFMLGMRATQVFEDNKGCTMICQDTNKQTHTVTAQKLLVAVGRVPNIDLGLEAVGVQTTKKNIVVNSKLQTTAKNIFAAGDVVGPYLFSHMAWYQAVIAARNAALPFFLHKKVDYTNVIWATFCEPELGTMGLSEDEARKKYGDTIRVYTKPYAAIDRAHTDRALVGKAKVICDKKGYILGATILGARAGDIIHELQVSKVRGIKFHNLHDVIHAYPTYAEIIWHMSKQAYVDRLQSSFMVRLVKKLFMK